MAISSVVVNGNRDVVATTNSITFPINITFNNDKYEISFDWDSFYDPYQIVDKGSLTPPDLFTIEEAPKEDPTYVYEATIPFNESFAMYGEHEIQVTMMVVLEAKKPIYEPFTFTVYISPEGGGEDPGDEPEFPDPDFPINPDVPTEENKILTRQNLNVLLQNKLANSSAYFFNTNLDRCPTYIEANGLTYGNAILNVLSGLIDPLQDNQLFTLNKVSISTTTNPTYRLNIILGSNPVSISNSILFENTSWTTDYTASSYTYYSHRIICKFSFKSGSTVLGTTNVYLRIRAKKTSSASYLTYLTTEMEHDVNGVYGGWMNFSKSQTVTSVSVEFTSITPFSIISGSSYTIPTANQKVNHEIVWPTLYLNVNVTDKPGKE